MKGTEDDIVRAWFLVTAVGLSYDEKLSLAKNIFCGANSKDKVERNDRECSEIESNQDDYAQKAKVIVVRADLVDSVCDLVVPVYVEFPDELVKIEERIREIARNMENPVELEIRILTVLDHVPFPPQITWGFITKEESNSPIGPQGHSPW